MVRRYNSCIQILIVSIFALMLPVSVFAITETYEIIVPPLIQDSTSFLIDGFGSTHDIYLPSLPTKTYFYRIPEEANNVKVKLVEASGTIRTGIADVSTSQPIYPGTNPDNIKQNKGHNLKKYPGELYKFSGIKILNGDKLAAITIYPVQYHFNKESIDYYGRYVFSITYSLPKGGFWIAKHKKEKSATDSLESEVIANYDTPVLSPGFATSDVPNGTSIKYAIITTSTFESSLQDLADWKTEKGIPAKVYLTSDIYSNYTGYDSAEEIRMFLLDLENQYDLDWVLLAGDVADVPTRSTWVADGEDTRVPSDYYYADLEGNYSPYDWDKDNDSVFGETEDEIDWMPEVYVGRLSAANAGQMETLVNRIINYEKSPTTGNWTNKAILAGGKSDDSTDEALLMKFIKDDFMNNTMTTETINYLTTYPRDYALNFANLEGRVDYGASLISWAGHGSVYSAVPAIGQSAFVSTSTAPTNGDKRPFVYANSCSTGAYDYATCLGEDVLRDWGIGFIGASRVSWYVVGWSGPSDPMNQAHEYRFNEQLFENNKYRPGQAFWDSKVDYIQDFDPFSYDPAVGMHYASRKNLLAYNLLGDPALDIWTSEPVQLDIVYTEEFIINQDNTIIVNVTANSTAVENATVCLTNGNDTYHTGTTDSSGSVTFSNVNTASDEGIIVTASMQNYIPKQGQVNASLIDILAESPIDMEFINPEQINFSYYVNTSYNISYCRLYVGSNLVETENNVIVNTSSLLYWNTPYGGEFDWYVQCMSTEGVEGSSNTETIHVIRMTAYDGNSTNLSQVDVGNITNLIVEKSVYGMINFTENINLSSGADLDSLINIGKNHIEVRSDLFAGLNKAATLTIKDISFHNPVILVDGEICGSCTILEEGVDYVKFQVSHFSTYSVTGGALDVFGTGTLNTTNPGNDTSEGGNTTQLDLNATVSTDRWQGYYGNVSGSLAFGYNTYVFYSFASSYEVAVYASQNLSFLFSQMEAAAAADVDTIWSYADGNDQAVDVFTQTTNISGVLAPSVELNPIGQDLNSTILDDGGTTTKDNFAFGAIIQKSSTCFDGKVCDFELMVPADGQEVYYLFLEVG